MLGLIEVKLYKIQEKYLKRKIWFSKKSWLQHHNNVTNNTARPMVGDLPTYSAITDPWPVPDYTAWWHRHMGV